MSKVLKSVTSLFSPKIPNVPAAPTPPAQDPAAIAAAEEAARRQSLNSRGRSSNIFAGELDNEYVSRLLLS